MDIKLESLFRLYDVAPKEQYEIRHMDNTIKYEFGEWHTGVSSRKKGKRKTQLTFKIVIHVDTFSARDMPGEGRGKRG